MQVRRRRPAELDLQSTDDVMNARRSVSVVDTVSSRTTGSELTQSVNGGKHLICLRDLTSK